MELFWTVFKALCLGCCYECRNALRGFHTFGLGFRGFHAFPASRPEESSFGGVCVCVCQALALEFDGRGPWAIGKTPTYAPAGCCT